MAAAADPSSSSSSPRSARAAARQPWSHVVRGEPEASAAAPPSPSSPPAIASLEPSDRSPRKPPPDDVAPSPSDATRGKKQAWKRPPNGSIEAGAPVMGGAASWPALSESAKASPKSLSSDALKPLSDGPPSASPGPAILTSSPKANSNPSSSPNHVTPTRQKSMKRGSGGESSSGTLADGGVAMPSPPPTSSPIPQANSDKQAPPELSHRDQPTKNTTNWDHGSRGGGLGSRAHDGGDQPRSYGGNRRWNNGGGVGAHHNNYGNRRDQERGGHDGYRRNAVGRDVHLQQRGARPYIRPPTPPVTPPFLSPPPARPFGNPMVFPDMPSPIFYVATQPPPGGVPFVPHPAVSPPMFIPAIDTQRASLLKQIDYYFSADNLCKDVFLRQNMGEQGWVPISLIAGFNRVRQLTTNIDFILDALRLSTVVEVQGEKIRKRSDWMNWVLPPSNNQFANISSQSPAIPNSDNLAARLQFVGLEGAAGLSSMRAANRGDVFLSRSASGNLSNQLPVAVNRNRDDNGQVIGLADSDRTKSGRSLVRTDTL